ncbi:MAG: TldD/PmbA family protein [Candidatus Lokiarchaeota archaeon]|nr:TldD/PmbA family protein [Candidatus Lokiarchaeota archaeon]
MNNEKIDLIERILNSKNIQEYEIYFTEKKAFESIFLKDKVDNEREIKSFEYSLRILSQKENKTGVGIVRGNSLNPQEIKQNIDTCINLSKFNRSTKYKFPKKPLTQKISIYDKRVIEDPLGTKIDLVEELASKIKQKKEVSPTFGRFRVHIDEIFLRNSNSIDVSALKTYFFIEFSLKAQKEGKLSEYWPFLYIKERKHLNFAKRVEKWVKLAQDTLKAKPPKPAKDATIIFSPQVLHDAINPVIGFQASGKAFHEKISLFKINEKVTSEKITMYDDGLLEGGFATNDWDGEGTPHQRNEIIKKGYFQKILYDQKYAMVENSESTGNGKKAMDGSIINGISNLEILPGDMTLNEIISNIKVGYYIEQFSWLNPSEITGTFGAEIRNGYYIKDGKFENPIKLGNVSGNVLKMIRDCQYISKEREYFENTLFPYMVFNNLTVSS